jgi:hypothetical protein
MSCLKNMFVVLWLSCLGCGSGTDPVAFARAAVNSGGSLEGSHSDGIAGRPIDSRGISDTKIKIPTRVFSPSPTLGAKETSVSNHNSPNYGALKVFFDRAAQYTNNEVTFSISSWSPNTGNSVIQQVGMSNDPSNLGVPRDAAYDSSSALNSVWGFLYGSIPFGPDFNSMVKFLYYKGGLELAQSLIDARHLNVKLLPVVGSPPQGSGYFKQPIGKAACEGEHDCRRQAPIGLEGLCQAGWVFRYFSAAFNVLDRACTQLVTEGAIPSKHLSIGPTILGQSDLSSIQLGSITAFEFATPLDDLDPPPTGAGYFPEISTVVPTPLASQNPGHKGLRYAHLPSWHQPVYIASQNPGHKGLRYAHLPSWHQPVYIGWLMVNKSDVWDKLPTQYQHAIERAAKEALEESYWYSRSLQCSALRKILDHNDGQVQLDVDGRPIMVNGHTVSADIKLVEWPKEALVRLKNATDAYLESLKGGATPTIDQKEYAQVINAIRSYLHGIGYTWEAKHFDYSTECRL